jgi:hypothetical protein
MVAEAKKAFLIVAVKHKCDCSNSGERLGKDNYKSNLLFATCLFFRLQK